MADRHEIVNPLFLDVSAGAHSTWNTRAEGFTGIAWLKFDWFAAVTIIMLAEGEGWVNIRVVSAESVRSRTPIEALCHVREDKSHIGLPHHYLCIDLRYHPRFHRSGCRSSILFVLHILIL